MGKENLVKFTCDNCGEEVITDDVPRGWVRILSTYQTGTHGVRGVSHNSHPPTVWSPQLAVDLPDDPYFCSPWCLSEFVLKFAEDVVERSKLKGH